MKWRRQYRRDELKRSFAQAIAAKPKEYGMILFGAMFSACRPDGLGIAWVR